MATCGIKAIGRQLDHPFQKIQGEYMLPIQRQSSRALLLLPMTMVAVAALTACGGSGSAVPTAITLSGTAATGAPMAGAILVVKDSTGAEVQSCAPCTVDGEGKFSVELKATAKAPFVLFATQDGSVEPQVSMIDTAQSATVNVSPITTLIATRLAPNGDPAQLKASDLTADKITTATTEVKTALQPLLEAAGVAADANPVTMAFKANSTGLDKALDILGKPSIVRTNDGKANVEIEIKTGGSDAVGDTSGAAKITLTAGAAPVASAGLTLASMKATLPADGVSSQIKGLMQRMQDCYATAPAERVASGATLASQITASVCKAIFVDNDPSKFLHNNSVVSQAGATLTGNLAGRFSGAFKGIFTSVQGIQFDLPEYRYIIKNGNTTDTTKPMDGDVVFTARWTVTDPNAGIYLGQSDVGEYQARVQNGELKLMGNQSLHDLNINAQARREEMPAVPDYAYLATGYNIGITERRWDHDNNSATPKVSIYEQVVVTSPTGKTFTFKPISGNNYDYLGLVSGNTITSSATVRLNGVYLNSATTGHPSERFTAAFWGSKSDWTDEAIKAIAAQGNWKFEITLTQAIATANPTTIANRTFTQYRRSINRAPTLAELQATKWPALKDPVKTTLASQASSQGFVSISTESVAANLSIDGWDVPSGAWSPTFAKVYGSTWDEGVDVSSTARKVNIPCAGTGAQCQKTNGTNTGKFLNAGYGYLSLSGRDSNRLQMSLNYSTRKTQSDTAP